MTTDINELVKRLRDGWSGSLRHTAADALEALAGEVERLREERDAAITDRFDAAADRIKAVAAERDRLKAALEKFIAEANTAPKRIIGNGIGGQTMEATLKASQQQETAHE